MSYILEALKKSEQERQQGKLPPFAAQGMILSGRKKPKSWVPMVVATALVANLLVFSYWLWRDAAAPAPAPASSAAMQAPAAVRFEPVADRPEPQVNLPRIVLPDVAVPKVIVPEVTAPSPGSAPEPTASAPPPEPVWQTATPEIIAPTTPRTEENTAWTPASAPVVSDVVAASPLPLIDELSAGQLARIPALTFNSHIYTPQPEARRVMINNLYLREGQAIGTLVVAHITEEGVVLDLDGQLFRLQALRDWRGAR